ncbi:MAG: glycosyltransferase family 4 protein [Anaerolineae bacterium]|uniref:glycosyltransferase family 4 protein n=1 Tax=Thermoflexus sp. TaxID=1969742 RepID=UPI0025D39D70|nr:glycosyltransferase family 4 protein [Thermoflexus sp.]MCS7350362.1 glycosyltransferase family 4 protein [Thermoflexus sp.]MDW8179813.1 glycosyltransferase family 4 protein [Anaerolineae bacterium]
MFVVLAAPHYPPRNVGGVEFYVQSLARWLHQQGHRVEVVCVEQIEYGPFPRVTARVDQTEGFPVHRLAVRWRKGPLGIRDRFDNPAMELWFKAYLHSRRPDVLHLHSGYLLTVSPLRAAMKMGLPTVVSLHDFWFLCAHHTLLRPSGQVCPGPEDPTGCAYCWLSQSRRYRWIEQGFLRLGIRDPHRKAGRLLQPWPFFAPWAQIMQQRLPTTIGVLNRATAIIVPTEFLAHLHRSFGMRQEGVYQIPYFVPSDLRRPDGDRRDPSALHVVYIGQVAPHKGLHVLIQGVQEAMRKVGERGRKIQLTIYGNDQAFPVYRAHLERLIGSEGNICFAGVLSRDRLGEALAEADVLALPSIWPEITGIVGLEALAMGVPVLASQIGGISEVISHGQNGWLVPPGDPQAIAEILACWAQEPEALERLRAQARALFSKEQAMEALMSLYRDIIRIEAPRFADRPEPELQEIAEEHPI